MNVELLKDDQYGANGPQSGDILEVFDWRMQDDEVWFFCYWHKNFPGENLYFVLPTTYVKAVHERG